ncbi:hypothetical protein HK102_009885, partial [Quaeritorhiza haematococci]
MFRFGIRLIRKTLKEINSQGKLEGANQTLFIDSDPVAVVYFRAGYAPTDYPSEEEWSARLLIERSDAIKCPNIAYHLVGSKKVQQVLAEPGMVERFLKDSNEVQLIRSCFTGLYPLDGTPEGLKAYEMAMKDPEGYVMKPQREGG